MRKIIILGATSEIAQSTARRFAQDGEALLLVGRDQERLTSIAADLVVRGAAEVQTEVCDLSDIETHASLIETFSRVMPGFDTVLVAYGSLGDQEACEQSYDKTFEELNVNFLSVVSLLTPIANIFEEAKRGTIAVIGSVAGDRGRKSNYIYGTAKGALALFLQGMRNRLQPAGVHVMTIKPGFVDTPMTAHIKKGPLFASADLVGDGIYSAIQKEKDVVYLPWFWQGIMCIIKAIPEVIFKRLSL